MSREKKNFFFHAFDFFLPIEAVTDRHLSLMGGDLRWSTLIVYPTNNCACYKLMFFKTKNSQCSGISFENVELLVYNFYVDYYFAHGIGEKFECPLLCAS